MSNNSMITLAVLAVVAIAALMAINFAPNLSSKQELANLNLNKMAFEDVLITQAEKGKIEKQVVNGVKLNVVELSYFLTPLKSGFIKIPPVEFEGAVSSGRSDFFDLFPRYQPFIKQTNALELEVKSPEMTPWLPADKLTIKEDWNAPSLQIHEPITRTIEIHAEGVLASQLPTLEMEYEGFKTYADSPVQKEEVINGKLISSKKQSYTLIPTQAGQLTLPEISLTWWDLTHNHKVISTLPAYPLQILPALSTPLIAPPLQEKSSSFLIPLLSLFLILALIWAVTLQFKMKRLKKEPLPPKSLKNLSFGFLSPDNPYFQGDKPKTELKKEKLKDLNPT